jgi:hypothetical protein
MQTSEVFSYEFVSLEQTVGDSYRPTSVASICTECGMVRPMAWPNFSFIMQSHVLGCSAAGPEVGSFEDLIHKPAA